MKNQFTGTDAIIASPPQLTVTRAASRVVVAESFPAAMKAAAAVNVDWAAGPTAKVSQADLFAEGDRLTQ